MLNSKLMVSLLAFGLLLVAPGLMAQAETDRGLKKNVPALLREANRSYAEKDYSAFRDAMIELNIARPFNSDYMYQLVIAHALMNAKTPAYDVMIRMQKQGLSYDFSANEDTTSIRNTQVFDYLNELMILAGDPMGESEVVFTLPESVNMPEAIAWDNSRDKFLVGTQSDGRILAVGLDGTVTELIKADNENGLWAVMGLLVDEANNRLWVSSAALPSFNDFGPADKGRSTLFEFNLESLELLNKYPVPVDGQVHILGNMVLTPEGDLFIVDRYLPLIYRKSAGDKKLKAVWGLKNMVSLRGICLNENGSLMYVADREMGITVIEIETGRSATLQGDQTLNLGGIDGLYFKDNSLVMIQNGISPQRVMMLQLDSSGTRITGIVPMAVAQPEFDYPSYGTILGGELYFFGNSHFAGRSEPRKAVNVMRAPLNSEKKLVPPDMRQFLERQARLQKEEDAKKAQEQQKDQQEQ